MAEINAVYPLAFSRCAGDIVIKDEGIIRSWMYLNDIEPLVERIKVVDAYGKDTGYR